MSSHRQRGTDQPFTPKVFSLRDGSVLSLVAEQPPGEPRSRTLTSPDIDGSGSRMSWTSTWADIKITCVALRCTTTITVHAESTFSARAAAATYPGRLRLSHSGRFGFLAEPQPDPPRAVVIDLVQGTRWDVPGTRRPPIPGRRIVADNGAVPLLDPPAVWTPYGGLRNIDLTGLAGSAVITPNGRFALYESYDPKGSPRELVLADLATGRRTILFTSSELAPLQPAISNDGSQVLFLSRGQVHLSDPTGVRALTAEPQGISEAVLSGDGHLVYAASNDGRLLRIRTLGGAKDELIPRTPQFHLGYTAVPGSYYRITAASMPRDVQVLVDGRPAPVLNVTPSEVAIQIPWEVNAATPRMVGVELRTGDSPFEHPPQEMALRAHNPQFAFFDCAPDGLRCPAIVHEDWRALVSLDNRAAPGEILHAYMTGLGPVDPPLTNGQPGPATIRDPFTCHMEEGSRTVNVPVLYAGMAPGLVGFYQVSFRMPDQIMSDRPWLVCRFSPEIDDTAIWWVLSRPNMNPAPSTAPASNR